mmetsp:Transcript_23698/g.51510  ORF Transcript_23698/g.51510 Transcript_23698/m.51510 type:complete len:242 (-) Transcript_23698:360-1085(-)
MGPVAAMDHRTIGHQLMHPSFQQACAGCNGIIGRSQEDGRHRQRAHHLRRGIHRVQDVLVALKAVERKHGLVPFAKRPGRRQLGRVEAWNILEGGQVREIGPQDVPIGFQDEGRRPGGIHCCCRGPCRGAVAHQDSTHHTTLLHLLGMGSSPVREVGCTNRTGHHHHWKTLKLAADMFDEAPSVPNAHIGRRWKTGRLQWQAIVALQHGHANLVPWKALGQVMCSHSSEASPRIGADAGEE